MKAICDKFVQFGPPDRVSNFQSSQKRKSPPKDDEGLDQSFAKKSIKVSDSIVEITPHQRSVFGKKVRMKFMTSSHDEQWFEGVSVLTGKYGVFLPYIHVTIRQLKHLLID